MGEPAAASTKPICAGRGDALPLLPSAAGQRGKPLASSPSHPPQQSHGPRPHPAASPRALEMPRPLRRRSQAPIETIFYSFPPLLGHSTEHTSASPQQHTRLFKRKHNSSVYFTTVRILPFLHTTGISLFRVNTKSTLQTPRALRRGTRRELTPRGRAARGLLCRRGAELSAMAGGKARDAVPETQSLCLTQMGQRVLPSPAEGCKAHRDTAHAGGRATAVG